MLCSCWTGGSLFLDKKYIFTQPDEVRSRWAKWFIPYLLKMKKLDPVEQQNVFVRREDSSSFSASWESSGSTGVVLCRTRNSIKSLMRLCPSGVFYTVTWLCLFSWIGTLYYWLRKALRCLWFGVQEQERCSSGPHSSFTDEWVTWPTPVVLMLDNCQASEVLRTLRSRWLSICFAIRPIHS